MTRLPRMSRCDFFRLTEGDLLAAVADAVREHAEADLTAGQLAVFAWPRLAADVPNGGFTQFFYNHGGDHGVEELAALLDEVGVPKAAAVLRDAVAVYREHRPAFQVDNPWDGLFGSIKAFDKLDRVFDSQILRGSRALEKWVRAIIADLAADEAGNTIDPAFTGAVEILQANGLMGEYLEVKKGKPSGAYRVFFDDGTVRQVVFYKAGKVTGDFWPDGQLRRKEAKRGANTVIEWYFPGGQVQKRYVKNKDGYAVEPTRRYHENGQLAEEVTAVEGKKVGPWVKFFADGSPQLQAEYVGDEKLVIHNAWADDGTQVVTDGTGVFSDDGRVIDWEYEMYFTHRWQEERELRNGVPHGKTTTYCEGVLYCVAEYANGVEHGERVDYYDNGRVESLTKYALGKVVKTRSYPKFDHPVPAVVLRVEADEKLYTAWGHVRVDEYPRVLNLDDVQRQLVVPDFLREVHERNQTGTTKSEYEDRNRFNDGIAYFLTVNEAGEVSSLYANGSGVYSGGHWETYPPFLRQLRFTPGRVRGRAVECRVLARVDHTFVEGKADLA